MKTDKIVIVGGGSAGWISASFLCKTFPEKKIIVIESPDHPVIGVGESTLGDISNFRDYLGIKEKPFMKFTDASYKLGIKFTDFYDVNSGTYYYPFKNPYLEGTEYGLLDWMEIKSFYPETPVQDFVRCYFPHFNLFENNKYMINDGSLGNWDNNKDVAYHFDAIKFGIWLRENYCIPRGVEVISANVIDAKVSENGIDYLILDDGHSISSDLFIDCTGFKSVLLGGFLKEPFKSYEDMLPNNRAWATQIKYIDKEKELECVTNCTAIENGWVWNIPLWSKIGTGYVYSDKYISKDDALKEFKKYLCSDKMINPRSIEEIESYEYKDIPMKVGIYERTWVKNVVAIGLSAGFVEPLESNGLFSVFWFISKLAKSLLRPVVSKMDKDFYNQRINIIYDEMAQFIAMHYSLSIRRDTKYWKDISERTFSQEVVKDVPVNKIGFPDLQHRKMFMNTVDEYAGITYISAGMNYQIFDRVSQKLLIHDADIKPYIDSLIEKFNIKKNYWITSTKNAPSLNRYLEKNIYS